MAKFVLCDTGFWIALYDKRDYYHGEATELFNKLALFHIIIPWPVLYEVLRTRFVRRREYVITFEKHLKILKIKYIDDTPYRRIALSELFKSVNKRTISLVDMIIRKILEDKGKHIDYLITFNEKDFIDICKKRRISVYSRGISV